MREKQNRSYLLSHAKDAKDAEFQSKLRCRWSSRLLRATENAEANRNDDDNEDRTKFIVKRSPLTSHLSPFLKHHPWHYALALMAIGVFMLVANVVSGAICCTIEAIVGTAGNVYGINETIFTQGIGKVPHGFLSLALYIKEFLAHACQCPALHLAMEIEATWQYTIGNKDELAEEAAFLLYAVVLHLFVSCNTDDDVVICHGTIAQTAVVGLQFLAVLHQAAQIAVGLGIIGCLVATSAIKIHVGIVYGRFREGDFCL